MDFFSNLHLAFSVILQPDNLLFCFIGCLIGTLVGVLPGLGPVATISLLLPSTFHISPVSAIIMLGGIYYGAMYGGSITSILVNIPGEAASVVTCLDGYKMARQGRAGPALGISAFGSFIAGTLATRPDHADRSPAGPSGPGIRAAGVFLPHGPGPHRIDLPGQRLHGQGADDGLRGDFSRNGRDGQHLRNRALHLPQLYAHGRGRPDPRHHGPLRNLRGPAQHRRGFPSRRFIQTRLSNLLPNWRDWKDSILPIIRGTFIGFFLGILPGGGAVIASFASYAVEKKVSKHPERFGSGAIEGVAGPESANNAASQGAFIPLLTLGIPANVVMAILLGALLIHNIKSGPLLIKDNPDLFWGVLGSMYVGNVMLLVLNLPLIGIWVQDSQDPLSHPFPPDPALLPDRRLQRQQQHV